MNKFSQFLDDMNEEELELFERELKEGYVGKYIERKKEFFRIKGRICAVCGNQVNEDCYVMIFGEPSIRKKAHFCGIDCLDYFIHKSIKDKNRSRKKIEKNYK